MTLPIWLLLTFIVAVVLLIYLIADGEGLWWVPLIGWPILAIGSISVVADTKNSEACKEAGGAWISRDSACVQSVPYKEPK